MNYKFSDGSELVCFRRLYPRSGLVFAVRSADKTKLIILEGACNYFDAMTMAQEMFASRSNN